jgi:hypothetical protein
VLSRLQGTLDVVNSSALEGTMSRAAAARFARRLSWQAPLAGALGARFGAVCDRWAL